MLEDVRRGVRGFVEAGVAAVSGALTPSRARDLARSMTQGQGVEQINRVAQELLDWSQRSREWIAETVQREVKRQLSAAGIATRDDLDALRKRVRELERSQPKSTTSSTLRAKKAGASRTRTSKADGGRSPATVGPAAEASAAGPERAAGAGDPSPPSP